MIGWIILAALVPIKLPEAEEVIATKFTSGDKVEGI